MDDWNQLVGILILLGWGGCQNDSTLTFHDHTDVSAFGVNPRAIELIHSTLEQTRGHLQIRANNLAFKSEEVDLSGEGVLPNAALSGAVGLWAAKASHVNIHATNDVDIYAEALGAWDRTAAQNSAALKITSSTLTLTSEKGLQLETASRGLFAPALYISGGNTTLNDDTIHWETPAGLPEKVSSHSRRPSSTSIVWASTLARRRSITPR